MLQLARCPAEAGYFQTRVDRRDRCEFKRRGFQPRVHQIFGTTGSRSQGQIGPGGEQTKVSKRALVGSWRKAGSHSTPSLLIRRSRQALNLGIHSRAHDSASLGMTAF